MQNKNMQLDVALGHLKGLILILFLQQYRENCYTSAIAITAITANKLADELDVPPIFKTTQTTRKKRLFDYESKEEVKMNALHTSN